MATLEAMASGLPLVVTRTGGTTELVVEGVNGFTFSWGDVKGLVSSSAPPGSGPRPGQAHGHGLASTGWDVFLGDAAARYYRSIPASDAATPGSPCRESDLMCGICGFFHPDPTVLAERSILEAMNGVLEHRGPDESGIFLESNIGMAMRRLAIIDIAGGQQPISSEDGTVVLVCNGEIYNFRELRAELERYGHQFKTHSDIEVILHAYEQWEYEALPRLNGMFAFSLWDASRQRLVLARDRMGKKPLYWTYSRNGLLWASEAKALLQVPWVERHINPVALHHYLTLQYTPNPLTIYEGIFQLPAAHKLLIWEGGYPRVSRWWQLNYLPKLPDNEAEIKERARDLLEAAVERRLISEVPLGAFLSGGIEFLDPGRINGAKIQRPG